MNLYEIDAAIMECVDEETGEIIDTDKLNELQMLGNDKVENIALYIKNLKAEGSAIKMEKDKLGKRQKVCENKVVALENYLLSYLQGGKFKTPRVSISYRKSETVVVDNPAELDKEYLKYAEPTVNKTAIKAAIKSGIVVTGAHLQQNQNIQIK